jgi:hypothetical protein
VAFLAVRSLDSRFGREKLLAFFERVVIGGTSIEAAATVQKRRKQAPGSACTAAPPPQRPTMARKG